MAFTEEQKNKLCTILNVVPSELTYQINLLSTDLTSQRQSDIETQIDRWDAGAGTKFTRIRANERNFGAEIDPSLEKADIRRNIAILFERPDWAGSGSRLVRA